MVLAVFTVVLPFFCFLDCSLQGGCAAQSDRVVVLAVGSDLWHSCHLLWFSFRRCGERSCERRVVVEGGDIFLLVWHCPWFGASWHKESACPFGDVRKGTGILLHDGRCPIVFLCRSKGYKWCKGDILGGVGVCSLVEIARVFAEAGG